KSGEEAQIACGREESESAQSVRYPTRTCDECATAHLPGAEQRHREHAEGKKHLAFDATDSIREQLRHQAPDTPEQQGEYAMHEPAPPPLRVRRHTSAGAHSASRARSAGHSGSARTLDNVTSPPNHRCA